MRTPVSQPASPSRWKISALTPGLRGVLLGWGWLALSPAALAQQSAEIQSLVQRGAEYELRLNLATYWDRRYRIESSTDLVHWETRLVTAPAQGPSLSVTLKGSMLGAEYFRSTPFDWEELRTEWAAARTRWRAEVRTSYEFQFRWKNCNCHPDMTDLVRVEVRDGVIAGVTRVSTGEAVPRDRWTYHTIEGLFDWLLDRLARHPVVMRIQFDPVIGHPTETYSDLSAMMADEEIGFEVTGVKPL